MTAAMQHTLLEILKKGTDYLGKQRVENPRLDAEVLFAHILKIERIQLYVQFDRPMSQDELDRYKHALILRARGMPVAYITGQREFMSLPISVGPGALIPRPESEILAEQSILCLEAFHNAGVEAPRAVDMCTGSGAIACAIGRHAPWSRVLAVDISQDALKYARANIDALQVADCVTAVAGDLFNGLPAEWLGVHVIASNPPYIPTQVMAGLQREISQHEPAIALDGGADGLAYYRRLAAEAGEVLCAGGRMLVEVGDGQADEVCSILSQHAWCDIRITSDYSGTPRVVAASPAPSGLRHGRDGSVDGEGRERS